MSRNESSKKLTEKQQEVVAEAKKNIAAGFYNNPTKEMVDAMVAGAVDEVYIAENYFG